MIEKLLRRFVSKETEFVLKAMELIGDDPDLPYDKRHAYEEMCRAQRSAVIRRADIEVLNLVERRLRKERYRKQNAAKAKETAARIMLGDDFKESRPPTISLSQAYAQSVAAPISSLQAHQQQLLNAQGLMNGVGGGLGRSYP